MDLELELFPNKTPAAGKNGRGKSSKQQQQQQQRSKKKQREAAAAAALIAKQAQEGGFNPFLGVMANKDTRKDEINYDWVRKTERGADSFPFPFGVVWALYS